MDRYGWNGFQSRANGMDIMNKFTVLALAGLLLTASTAQAKVTSLVTGSVGTQLGVSHTQQLNEAAQADLVSELEVTMKLFRILALELAYNPAAPENAQNELVFHSRVRLAGQIHFIPLDVFSMYLSAGLGAQGFEGFASVTEDTNSYQGGVGAEVFIGEHMAIGAEYLMVVPGIRSIQHNIVSNALEATLGGGTEGEVSQVGGMSPTDFISPSNFQTTVGLRYYF